ncbi:helix-turn-helix domain-containing protein [Saccharopolyspora hattusasensis]|uniref:helix-turn-helix domain-containing protein n=1 Tax=Saccharopolyspora hattusasensis TaxID=1128679 RepID=UPI003D988E46
MSDFGRTLRQLRQAAGFSQPQLARQVPVDQSTLSRWENGRSIPDMDTVEQLDNLLNAAGRLAQLINPAKPGLLAPTLDTAEPVTTDHLDELRKQHLPTRGTRQTTRRHGTRAHGRTPVPLDLRSPGVRKVQPGDRT